MHFLDAPIVIDEIFCQPIKQFRMCGLFTEVSKIIKGSDQASTEMPLPKAIDDNPGGELIVRSR